MENEPQHAAGRPAESRPQATGFFPNSEPAVVRYVCLLWRHRVLLLGGSLLPAVLVALILYVWPPKYAATFFYERPLAESEYDVLLRRFHSQENLDKMIDCLRERGLTGFVQRLERARTRQSFEKLIRFDVSPMYPKRLQTTDPCTSEKISEFRTKLLSVKILGGSEAEVAGASAVVTGNIESVLPLYDIRNYLKETIAQLRDDTAKIEGDRFKLTADLQKEQAKLEKLKTIQTPPAETAPASVVLQFSNAEKSIGYLPLSYQVPAVQAKVVDLQETLTNNTGRYNFYLQMLEIDSQLLAKIEENLLTYHTAQEYLDYLREQLRAYQDKDQTVGDHLKSYLRKMENLAQVNTRAGERPVVHPVSRHVGSYSALAFLLSWMAASFVAVLGEYRRLPGGQAVRSASVPPRPGVPTPRTAP